MLSTLSLLFLRETKLVKFENPRLSPQGVMPLCDVNVLFYNVPFRLVISTLTLMCFIFETDSINLF